MWLRTMHFRRSEAGPFAVGAVAEQGQYSLLPQSRKPGIVRQIAIERGLVQLKIAGVNNRSHRRRDGHPNAVGDAVRHAQDFYMDLPEIQRLTGFDEMQLRLLKHSVFLQPPAGKSKGQTGAVNGNREFSQQIGEGADVVLMAMRHDDATHLFLVFQQVGEIRDYEIHAQQFISGKHQSGIDDNDIVAIADRHHVHAEFPKSAEGDNFHPIVSHDFYHSGINGEV